MARNTSREIKLAREQEVLKAKLAAQAREVRIEAGLEKVRQVAMRMKKPADMLVICKTIAQQLTSLGVHEIRNIQTAIFYFEKGFYTNYQYYAKHDKTFVTDTDYTDHKLPRAFAAKMRKGKGQLSFSHIKGRKQVKDWVAYQKGTNVFIDTYLDTADYLGYYWYSLGPVAMGISTYQQLSKEDMELFKRFRNVFDLAYRRYLDIEKAEAQAKEARIEAALEKVRAQAMGMHRPDDILNVCKTIYKELPLLGFKDIRNVLINFWDDGNQELIDYDYSDFAGGNIAHLSYSSHPVFEQFQKTIRRSKDAFAQMVVKKDQLASWRKRRKESGEYEDPRLSKIDALYYYFYSIEVGAVGISAFSPLNEEHLELLKRFRNVFNLAYRRYIDIENAETQAREAKVQLALERVRARTMAMQHSEELSETVAVLFEQFKSLGEEPERMAIEIVNEEAKVFEIWATQHGGSQLNLLLRVSIEEPHVMQKMYKAWKAKKKSITIDLQGKALEEYFLFLKKAGLPVQRKIFGTRRVQNVATFSRGILTIITPEPRPGETIQLLERFAAVFDGTYTRFLDLQKAEAQAREALIQLALERVRARTMAMHKSEEIKEIVKVFFGQLKDLQFAIDGGVFIGIPDAQQSMFNLWVGDEHAEYPNCFRLPYHEAAPIADVWKAYQEGLSFVSKIYPKTTKNRWFRYAFQHTDFTILPAELKQWILEQDVLTQTFLFSRYSGVGIHFHHARELTAEETGILKRFAYVFEQGYIRFLDLQKAEAQAREAQIEIGLERVRSRAMAMQSSEELNILIGTVFTELTRLDLALTRCIIWVFEPETNAARWWMANSEEPLQPMNFLVNYHEHPAYLAFVRAWKEQQVKMVYDLRGQDKKSWDNILFNDTELANLPGVVKNGMRSPERVLLSGSFNNFGGINTASLDPLSEEHFDILLRFAKVFDLTYTRFLDLQKAEAQVREARIEAALERVRSRSMAMYNSHELEQVIRVLTDQLTVLGFHFHTANFITNESMPDWEIWISSPGLENIPPKIHIPYIDHPLFNERNNDLLDGKEMITSVLDKKEKNRFYRHLFKKTAASSIPEERKQWIYDQKGVALTTVLMKTISFSVVNYDAIPYTAEENEVIRRLGKVFEQSYTRFLDLQKAEAQAKESQIQLALERVRARTMAMQQSTELPEAAQVLFQQVQSLGMPAWSAGYCTWNEDNSAVTLWMSSEGVVQPPFTAPTTEDELFIQMRKGHEQGKALHVVEMGGNELLKHYQYMRTLPVMDEILDSIIAAGHPLPSFQIMHQAYFSKGFLLFITYEPVPDAHDIFKRFANVFEQTYTRFLDLQMAEAQAREAQVQLALERVRARTMAMHHSDELKETTHILFEQMKELGEPVEQLSIGIVNEENNVVEISATVHGDTLNKIFSHSIDEPYMMAKVYKAWKEQQKTLVVELRGDELNAYNQYRNELTNSKMFPTDLGKEYQRIVYAAFFSKGMLALGANETRPPESLQLLVKFASVFDLTYTRFIDLQKAEAQAREAQIEGALERVRSRSLGMQKSEELKEVIKVVYDQLVLLGIRLDHAGFVVDYQPYQDWHFWIADEQDIPAKITHPYFESTWASQFHEAKEKDWGSFVTLLNFEEKNRFYQELLSHVPGLPESSKAYYLNCPGLAITTVLFKEISLYIENFDAVPFSEEENRILQRFGKVFEQTYTRFLDLQKAEAQAREAQIEASLERVRSKTMAMHKSEEVTGIAVSLNEELLKLGFEGGSTIIIIDKETGYTEQWTGFSQDKFLQSCYVPYFEHPCHDALLDAWKRGDKFLIYTVAGDEKKALDEHYFATGYKDFPETDKKWMREMPAVTFSHAYMKYGAIHWGPFHLTEEQLKILQRFSRIFEQSYTRFLDLQKAEAQARESQIQLALERVRARTMAMQHSSELAEASFLLDSQVRSLGIRTRGCAFNIYGEHESTEWFSSEMGTLPVYKTPREGLFLRYYEAGKRGEKIHIETFAGENCAAHYEYLSTIPIMGDELRKMKAAGIPFPSQQTDHVVYFKYGYLLFITLDPAPEAHDIFIRFAAVFEQTYTRFIDLRKAEAQTKEAQIEAALERVRSKTMAMHSSQDVADTVDTLFNELVKLDIRPLRCGLAIIHHDRIMEVWSARPNEEGKASLVVGKLDTGIHPLLSGAYESWKKKNETYSYILQDGDVERYFTAINNSPDYPIRYDIEALPSTIYHNEFGFAEGSLFSFSIDQISAETAQVLKRFAAVFGQTYRRYLDLQKAEAQAREAQIETALEKVRSRTMAMQNSNELQETAAVLYQEFKKLGTTDLYQFTIGIYDEEGQKIDFRSTSWANDGEQESRSFHLDMNEPTLLQPVIKAWKAKQRSVVVDLRGEALEKWLEYRNRMSGVTVKSSDTGGRRVVTVAFYSKGHLSISTPQPLPAETQLTLERFAAVFDVTYTRFNDLQKAEAQAKEAQIEAALERVRSRTLAMQKSDELSETAAEVFRQLIGLGIEPNRLYIGIVNASNKDMEMWATDEDGTKVGKKFTFNAGDNASVGKLYEGWLEKVRSVSVDMQGEELASYISYLQYLQIPISHALTQKRRVQTVAYFDKGFIGMASTEEQSKETVQLLERFAAVFNLTFTRFNDLKIAEAHALQAEQDLEEIKAAKQRAEETLTELQATQKQLIQSEKMASLGELTAGIAHEIQNPLNFVNNFSEVSNELLQEMLEEVEKGNFEEVKAIADDVKQNLEKINHHGKRADGIVKGMLQHSRSSSGQKELTDINALCDEYLRLAYHGLRAKDKSFNAKFETRLDDSVGKVSIMAQDMGRVILNLINNAFYAVSEKRKLGNPGYEPAVTISTKKENGYISIGVQDNGGGIPKQALDKIFQPFFTTKPTGQGTGLGLSLSYDIVKAHGGELNVKTAEGTGSEFIILLPVNS